MFNTIYKLSKVFQLESGPNPVVNLLKVGLLDASLKKFVLPNTLTGVGNIETNVSEKEIAVFSRTVEGIFSYKTSV